MLSEADVDGYATGINSKPGVKPAGGKQQGEEEEKGAGREASALTAPSVVCPVHAPKPGTVRSSATPFVTQACKVCT